MSGSSISIWVREVDNPTWVTALIDEAKQWRHGLDMDASRRVRDYIACARDQLRG